MKMNGTGGGSENSEHQKPPGYLQVTCREIAGKQQEEGFAWGLQAGNTRVLPYRACPRHAHGLSRVGAVDNLWITRGVYPHAPHSRLTGVWWGFGRSGYPYPTHAPHVDCGGVCAPLPGVVYGQKRPPNDRRRKTPGRFHTGAGYGGWC